jgi:nucleotide-binding universal stress UspA family protein
MAVTRARTAPLRTLLVPLDGSPLAEQAVPVAAMLAKVTGAKLHFATVAPSLAEREYLRQNAEAVATTHGVETSTALLQGHAPLALAAYVEEHDVDLVVMTTHGRGGASRLWLGSVADQLLRRTAAPVLLLRAGRPTPSAGFHSILVGLDGSPESEAALGPALSLAATTPGSHVVLAQVIEPLVPEIEIGPATGWLEHLAHRARLKGIPATARVVLGNRVAESIHQLAQTTEADLIVVGTHATRGIERLALGSVADKVVRGADQAVLVVPRKAARPRRRTAPNGAQPGTRSAAL